WPDWDARADQTELSSEPGGSSNSSVQPFRGCEHSLVRVIDIRNIPLSWPVGKMLVSMSTTTQCVVSAWAGAAGTATALATRAVVAASTLARHRRRREGGL